ncbi:MAG: PEP-utilizing enzyme [Candidatus Staskawiczbacteria bacterium]
MIKKSIYKNYFARDFTLAMLEVWWRGEVSNPKVWTEKKQPHLPYIVFENIGSVTNGFYNPLGVEWVEQLLIDKVKETGSYDFAEIPFRRELKKLKPIFLKEPVLDKKNLLAYLQQCEEIWPWFESVWWGWESELYNKYKNVLAEPFARLVKLRDEYEFFVPGSEATVRKSLKKIYPLLGNLTALLRIEEIAKDNPPPIKILKKRALGYFFTDNQLFLGKDRDFIEKKFNIKLEKIVKNDSIKEFKGQSAFKGIVRGVVKIVYGARQINKVKTGDIIVAPMTLPDILPAMKKAIAFVTDEGGVVCHAAIIAREMKKPCIVGTKIATQVLKDGDLVEVDANKGIVKILKRK